MAGITLVRNVVIYRRSRNLNLMELYSITTGAEVFYIKFQKAIEKRKNYARYL